MASQDSKPPVTDKKPATATGTLGKLTSKVKEYTKFWADHVKKGEAPWTQWYCCGVVTGQECEQENHRIHKACKKCNHHVCENCVKGSI
ncbi:uncharacterized protein RSE6_00552 [Rhynchosporium secalis]|uniref:Uncharacterized protein n=1 Tax=Rhynchosporium secalis TaxID=38038 RepID=A0A1E1LVJ4_RHYSE|nr:uncharacterized protein RSE6_00552 [Rhynchosporium secalis]